MIEGGSHPCARPGCGHPREEHWNYYGGLSGCRDGCACEWYSAPTVPARPFLHPEPAPTVAIALPVARVRAPLWRRALAWLRALWPSRRCYTCGSPLRYIPWDQSAGEFVCTRNYRHRQAAPRRYRSFRRFDADW